MLTSTPIIAFIPATDLDRARTFYETVLGLQVEEVSDFACAFRGGGTQLRVTKVDSLAPHPFTVLGWAVADIAATMVELAERGVEFLLYDGLGQDAHRVWIAPSGARIAWFRDPAGNTLSLTQFA